MRGLRADSGVITNYTLLDTQPVLGNWKIKVTSYVSFCKVQRTGQQIKQYAT